jgi:hypothetical protein
MIAYCGLACQTCPIYLATKLENKEEQARMRSEIVEQCKGHYRRDYRLEEITDCDGCQTEGGRLFSGCKDCCIRKCARGKKLKSCAYCTDYACEDLMALYKMDPTAKTRLDEMRKSIFNL